jgi:hypothetical protein
MTCPDCGSDAVTEEVGPSGTATLTDSVRRTAEGDDVVLVRACWTCGWRETRRVRIETVTVEPGDQATIDRRRLDTQLAERASELTASEHAESLAAIDRIAGDRG